MKLRRALAGLLLGCVVVVLNPGVAWGCSCIGDPLFAAQEVGPPDVVFTGAVVASGESAVTASGGTPGLALQFQVDEVRRGDVGSTVVVHTPGGPAGGGNCSIGVVQGQQLVAIYLNPDGELVGGTCSIVSLDPTLGGFELPEQVLAETFGPARSPDPGIEPERLAGNENSVSTTERPWVAAGSLGVGIAGLAIVCAGALIYARRRPRG